MLALDKDPGAYCEGVALQLQQGSSSADLAMLRERELVSAAYMEKTVELELAGGQCITALAYVIDSNHVQYCGSLPLDKQARIIVCSEGGRGTNRAYLRKTAEQFKQLGIHDREIENLDALVEKLKDA